MKYYAALLKMQDPAKSQELRPQHVEFLDQKQRTGNIFARGRFADNAGGLVIYMAGSLGEALSLARSDPYIISGARSLELHEWEMKLSQ